MFFSHHLEGIEIYSDDGICANPPTDRWGGRTSTQAHQLCIDKLSHRSSKFNQLRKVVAVRDHGQLGIPPIIKVTTVNLGCSLPTGSPLRFALEEKLRSGERRFMDIKRSQTHDSTVPFRSLVSSNLKRFETTSFIMIAATFSIQYPASTLLYLRPCIYDDIFSTSTSTDRSSMYGLGLPEEYANSPELVFPSLPLAKDQRRQLSMYFKYNLQQMRHTQSRVIAGILVGESANIGYI